ncbi:hypothetical protein Tcan_16170 [Toxocara canis]|uniref:Uncharacterized protein n=1 Tax=Toxocara canis TaxID=6265 RepID=A0A0B2VUC0_TOXCA|nr:hypothetical protein Tcan_16170 [Toxocara canis]
MMDEQIVPLLGVLTEGKFYNEHQSSVVLALMMTFMLTTECCSKRTAKAKKHQRKDPDSAESLTESLIAEVMFKEDPTPARRATKKEDASQADERAASDAKYLFFSKLLKVKRCRRRYFEF